MWPVIDAVGNWVGRWFAAVAPQRADFESLVGLLRQRIADMDAEFQVYRRYTGERIKELQADAEECRQQRDADAGKIERLEGEVRGLKREVAELRVFGGQGGRR